MTKKINADGVRRLTAVSSAWHRGMGNHQFDQSLAHIFYLVAAHKGPMKHKMIQDITGMASSTTSRNVLLLRRAGLLDSIADGDNASHRRACLTKKGTILLRNLIDAQDS